MITQEEVFKRIGDVLAGIGFAAACVAVYLLMLYLGF